MLDDCARPVVNQLAATLPVSYRSVLPTRTELRELAKARPHHAALPAGFRLHWYEIDTILGQGGFGITYLASDTNLKQKVAIKEFLPTDLAVRTHDSSVEPMSDGHVDTFEWGLTRFITEAQTLAKFRHPNIVPVHSVFEENNTAYMVMGYVEGETLEEALKFQRIKSEEELLGIILPLLDGLEQIHEAGFIHRDIKPENIFVQSDGTAVLLDFGSARQAVGAHTQTLTALVSPGYAPFEQYGASQEQDAQGPWTDIYALGATLYRAINGRGPTDAIARATQVLGGGADSLTPAVSLGEGAYSRHFLLAIDNALKVLPEQRPQSVHEWRAMFDLPDTPDAHDEHDEHDEHEAQTVLAPTVPHETSPRVTETEVASAPHRFSQLAWVIAALALLGLGFIWLKNAPEQNPQQPSSVTIEPTQIPEPKTVIQSDTALEEAQRIEDKARELEQMEHQLEQERLRLQQLEAEAAQRASVEQAAREAEAEAEAEAERKRQLAETQKQLEEEQARVAKLEADRLAAEAEQAKAAQAAAAEVDAAREVAAQASEQPVAADTQSSHDVLENLLRAADEDLAALRLTSPKASNAYDRYTEALTLDGGNERALEGLRNVTMRYIGLARRAADKGEFDRAAAFLRKADSVTPNSALVERASAALDDARTQAAIRTAAQAQPEDEPVQTPEAQVKTAATEVPSAPVASKLSFTAGAHEPQVTAADGECGGIRLGSLTATEDTANGKWQHPRTSGAITLSSDGKTVRAKLSGGIANSTNERVTIEATTLQVTMRIRHSEGHCALSFRVPGLMAR